MNPKSNNGNYEYQKEFNRTNGASAQQLDTGSAGTPNEITMNERLIELAKTLDAINALSSGIRTKLFGSFPQNGEGASAECLDDFLIHAIRTAHEILDTLIYVDNRIN